MRTSTGLKRAVEHHRPNDTNRERCEGERQCGEDTDRRSVTKAIIAREPGLLRAALRALGNADYRSGGREFETLRFLSDLKKSPIEERDARKMIAEVKATSWRLHECIRVRELAATHRVKRMRRFRMLVEQEARGRLPPNRNYSPNGCTALSYRL